MTAILFTHHPHDKPGHYMYSVDPDVLKRAIAAYPAAASHARENDIEGVAEIADELERQGLRLAYSTFASALLPGDHDDEMVAVLIAVLRFWGVRFQKPKIPYRTRPLPEDWHAVARAGAAEDE